MKRRFGIGPVVLSLLIAGCFSPRAFAKDEPKWIEVHSAHFSVLTDAGDKRGREVALRMEQMRAVFGQLILKDKLKMSVPITVIALKSDKQYGMVAPVKQSMAAGFYVPGWDRIYIVLNLFEADPWHAVAHSLAHYLLNYNYPPAQGWFDEGLAEYFGSIHISKEVEIGGDPELQPEWHEDIFDVMRRDPNVPQSLTQLVSSPVWLSMVDLFTMKHDESGMREGTHNTLYYAQAWMVVHYLVRAVQKCPEDDACSDAVAAIIASASAATSASEASGSMRCSTSRAALTVALPAEQPSRALGKSRSMTRVNDRRKSRDAEHPAPGILAILAITAFDTNAIRMPKTMLNWNMPASRPRCLGGAISEMYIGATTVEMPMPKPPMTRATMNMATFGAKARAHRPTK